MNNLGFAKIYTAAKIQNLRNERNVRKIVSLPANLMLE